MVDTVHPAGYLRVAAGTVADLGAAVAVAVAVAGDAVAAVFGRDIHVPVSVEDSYHGLPGQEDPADDAAEGSNHTDRPPKQEWGHLRPLLLSQVVLVVALPRP